MQSDVFDFFSLFILYFTFSYIYWPLVAQKEELWTESFLISCSRNGGNVLCITIPVIYLFYVRIYYDLFLSSKFIRLLSLYTMAIDFLVLC